MGARAVRRDPRPDAAAPGALSGRAVRRRHPRPRTKEGAERRERPAPAAASSPEAADLTRDAAPAGPLPRSDRRGHRRGR